MPDNNEHIILIFKYLSGDISKTEKIQLFDWIKERKENRIIFNDYQKIWDISAYPKVPEIETIDINAEWEIFKNETDFDDIVLNAKTKFSVYRFAAIASVILLIGFTALYLFYQKQEVLYAQNEIIETKLSDGSEISINKNSKISISNKFNKEERRLALAGEAYFKVEKDKTKPFVVEAESFYVEVLGTEFYINSVYNKRQVVVFNGTVYVYQNKDKSDKVILTAGEEVVFDIKENKIRKIETNNENYISWKTKIFNFNNQSLEDIFALLEEVYNIKFELKNPQLKNCKISVLFENQDIDGILNVLQATFDNISFVKNKNTVYVDGNSCN
jgi:ferric-dicitrate binding protein FerR (iron transport regulator)